MYSISQFLYIFSLEKPERNLLKKCSAYLSYILYNTVQCEEKQILHRHSEVVGWILRTSAPLPQSLPARNSRRPNLSARRWVCVSAAWVRECSMLLSGACVSAARCAHGRAWVLHATVRSMCERCSLCSGTCVSAPCYCQERLWVLLAVLRDVRECSMLLSGACVSAARSAQGRAWVLHATIRSMCECCLLCSGTCVSAPCYYQEHVWVLLAVLRDVHECSMLLSGACVSAACCALGRAWCSMLLSGACVSAACCALGRAWCSMLLSEAYSMWVRLALPKNLLHGPYYSEECV